MDKADRRDRWHTVLAMKSRPRIYLALASILLFFLVSATNGFAKLAENLINIETSWLSESVSPRVLALLPDKLSAQPPSRLGPPPTKDAVNLERSSKIVSLLAAAARVAVVAASSDKDFVEFNFSNLTTNAIWLDVSGLPATVNPGALIPVTSERSGTTWADLGAVPIKDTVTLSWTEAREKRHVQFKRKDLALPARLESAKIQFTYIGGGKWRIKATREGQPEKVLEVSESEKPAQKE